MPRRSPAKDITQDTHEDIENTVEARANAPALSSPRATNGAQHVEEQLETIIRYLHHLDRRDRWRTYGSFVHALISIIPIALLLGSAWYVYEHGAEMLQMIAAEAAKQAATYSQGSMDGLLEQLGESFQVR